MGEDYRHIQVTPCVGALGAEVAGVDLAGPLSDAVIAEIRQCLNAHLLIVFRDQTLSPGQQVRFAQRFGELKAHPYIPGLDGHPEVMVVKKEPGDRHNFAGAWHTDTTYQEIPTLGSMLYALEVPRARGDTLFCNLYAAYESLSAPFRAFLDTLQAEHSFFGGSGLGRGQENGYGGQAREIDGQARAVHPLIRTHPETGRRALYVNAMFTESIVGLSPQESKTVLEYLYTHCVRAEFVHRLRWTAGTLAFWDNRCTMHYPLDDYPGERRIMHRITIAGDRPV